MCYCVIDDLLVAPGSGELSFIDFTDPSDPERNTISFPNRYFWQRIDLIDVFDREVAYLPQGFYGVDVLDFEGAFTANDPPSELPKLQLDTEEVWISLEVDLLIQTSAVDEVLLGRLDSDEIWMFSEFAEQIGYEGWMRGALGLDGGDTVPSGDADSDGDGLINSWEYFSGSHPGDSGDGVPFESWVSSDSDGERYLNIRLPYNLHASDGVSTVPQFSNDLQNWIPFPEAFEMTEEDFNPARVYRYLEPVGSLENLFIRLLLSTEGQ